jgi:hypothetical protein
MHPHVSYTLMKVSFHALMTLDHRRAMNPDRIRDLLCLPEDYIAEVEL